MNDTAALPPTANPGGVAMPLYQGTKQLRALMMTRGDYNAYRGWAAPDGEDQSIAGYLVEYVDGGLPNDGRHTGYISWSPADVFEKAYRPCGSHVERMRIEFAELSDRTRKLELFIAGPQFDGLQQDDRVLLREQLAHMEHYQNTLGKRLVRATGEGQAHG